MIKVLVTDLDGTILFNDTIPDAVIEGIEVLSEHGIRVCIASGRMLSSIYNYYKILKLNTPIIAYNGAMIGDKDLNIIYHEPIGYPVWLQIFEVLARESFQINLYFNDKLYIFRENSYGSNYPLQNKVPAVFVNNLEDIPKLPTTKVLGIGSPDLVKETQFKLRKMFDSRLYITTSSPTYLEIMNSSVSKGRALRFLSEILDVSVLEIAGLGDSFNDFELIRDAGFGITFNNSPKELKEIADYVTKQDSPKGFEEVVDFIIWKNLYST
ncbi:MAG: Cof-type HAD-IIB family hydrolase [bacterium]|nr:Cof-type HAD-IIB family hydrolase [bacterium]